MKLFENLPSTKTPINAENLNQIQDNLVVVSATEPTGDNREKVWIQKGKNLFNKNNYNLYKGFIQGENLFFVNNDYANTVYLRVKPNTTYTISRKIVHTDFAIGTGSFIPIANKQRINSYRDYKNELSATITTGTEDKYIYIYLLWSDGATTTLEEVLQGLQIEQGTTATEYEAYIEPKIYVKNDNGIYEEFSENTDTGWIDISFCLNTSIFSIREGQTPLVRKIGNVVYLRGEVYISTKPNEQTNIMFSNLPAQFVPKYQVTGAGVTYATFRPYSIWTEDDTIRCNIDNTDVQVHISGFDLCNLAPYIVD